MTDWLNPLLDRIPEEAPAPGFEQRVHARLATEPTDSSPVPSLWRGSSSLFIRAIAASLILALGFWMGRGNPSLQPIETDPASASASMEELALLFENQELLEAWEFVADEDLELSWS
ncbi:MAG: hypothetical protein MK213_01800, partial [Planctomycetes bacterium]|nr:hypothetical protein [Planctomycetota bacterium]